MPSLHTRIGRLSQWTRTFRLGRRAPVSTQRNQPPARILTYDEQVELLDAYRGLRGAERRTGATLGCARGADMSDAATVRALAKMLDGLGAAASVPTAEIRSGISPLDWREETEVASRDAFDRGDSLRVGEVIGSRVRGTPAAMR